MRGARFTAAGDVSFARLQTVLPSIALTKRRLKHLEACRPVSIRETTREVA